ADDGEMLQRIDGVEQILEETVEGKARPELQPAATRGRGRIGVTGRRRRQNNRSDIGHGGNPLLTMTVARAGPRKERGNAGFANAARRQAALSAGQNRALAAATRFRCATRWRIASRLRFPFLWQLPQTTEAHLRKVCRSDANHLLPERASGWSEAQEPS